MKILKYKEIKFKDSCKYLETSMKFVRFKPLPSLQIQIEDAFWLPRLTMNAKDAIPYQWDQLEKSRCIDNFRIVAKQKDAFREGFFYSDSDAYKWLEAAIITLARIPSPAIQKIIDEYIEILEKAQWDDGYLYTYNQFHFPDRKWANIQIEHELYSLGHLIESAVADTQLFHREKLLQIAKKAANLLVNDFLLNKSNLAPGHQEIELALIKLYRLTSNQDYLNLAELFLNNRGKQKHFGWQFLKQAVDQGKRIVKIKKLREKWMEDHQKKEHGTDLNENRIKKEPFGIKLRSLNSFITGKYNQQHKPIRDQITPEGHSVRWGYMMAAMAMLYQEKGDAELLAVMEKAWAHLVENRMFITGGLGSIPYTEGFGFDHELNNEYAYCETCAALGNMFFNWEMLLITENAKYADLYEWQLYNAASVGIALDGKSYLYRNPLQVDQELERRPWFHTPCCPSNVSRTWGCLEEKIYTVSDEKLWIHQYIGNHTKKEISILLDNTQVDVSLKLNSDLPWNGNVSVEISPSIPANFAIYLRIPHWTVNPIIKINGDKIPDILEEHIEQKKAQNNLNFDPFASYYVSIQREWQSNDILMIEFPMEVVIQQCPENVKINHSKIAISRGPIVYCLESLDNPNSDIFNDKIDLDSPITSEFQKDLLKGINVLKGLMQNGKPFVAIPYYSWANREKSGMNTWFHY
jgi:uncharacterized protein